MTKDLNIYLLVADSNCKAILFLKTALYPVFPTMKLLENVFFFQLMQKFVYFFEVSDLPHHKPRCHKVLARQLHEKVTAKGSSLLALCFRPMGKFIL